MPGHTKCCTCHAKSSWQTWRSDAPKCNPSQEISAQTSSHLWWTCLLYCACHATCIFPVSFLHFWLGKRASRHSGVHFFAKSGPSMVCFVHFDLAMCFVLQRRALFQYLNFRKWCEPGLFCTFWFANVLRATTACNFPTSQLLKVLRSWGVPYILTSKCALRHNGVQFFISHLARWFRTRRFSEPTFRPSGATIHWKNVVFRDLPLAHLHLPSSGFRLSLLWSSLFFSSLIFSYLLWLFPSLLFICPYCRKFDFQTSFDKSTWAFGFDVDDLLLWVSDLMGLLYIYTALHDNCSRFNNIGIVKLTCNPTLYEQSLTIWCALIRMTKSISNNLKSTKIQRCQIVQDIQDMPTFNRQVATGAPVGLPRTLLGGSSHRSPVGWSSK